MAKRGRKRKAVEQREPSGRIRRPVRAMAERAATHVAEEARIRVHGLPKAIAGHEKAGSSVGRLLLAGEITQEQYEAGQSYIRLDAAQKAALDVPGRVVEPRDGEPIKACAECGAIVRCDDCAGRAADWAREAWDAVQSEFSRYERAVLDMVLFLDFDQPPGLVRPILEKLDRHFQARAKKREFA